MNYYRGGSGQWSFVLHRVTGLGILLFLCIHILDTALIVLGPELYNKVIRLYHLPVFRVSEVGLFAAVLYHALNGVRITLMDIWLDLTRFHELLFRIQTAGFVLFMIPVAWLMLRPLLQ